MLEGIPVGLLDGLGVVGVVLLLGLGFGTGRLFTKRQYDDAVRDRNEWRAEVRLRDAELAEKNTQLRHLAEVGRTVDQIMRALSVSRSRASSREEES